jgi:hypothetical protein
MNQDQSSTLWEALGSFRLSEVLRWDLGLGLIAGGLTAWLAIHSLVQFQLVLPVAASLVGVVIGAVLAGVAVMAAFLDQSFLRKLDLIGREPIHYIAPLLFTVFLGILASIVVLIAAAMPQAAPVWIDALTAGLVGLFVVWTLASLIPDMSMLVSFVRLQVEAARISDEDVVKLRDAKSNHG